MNRQEISTAKCKLFKMENLEQENKIAKIFWMGSTIDQRQKKKEAVNIKVYLKKFPNSKNRGKKLKQN